MEFWGVEVKPGQALSVKPGDQKYLHLSQATLGELKKDKSKESVTIFLKIDEQKLVLGILSAEKFPQLSFDLVFEKEFELSHNGKSGSIYCMGYQASAEDQEHEEYSDSDFGSEDEELALQHVPNGKPIQKEEKSIVGKHSSLKPETSKKTHSKSLEPSKEDEDDDSEDDDESDDEDSSDESDEEMLGSDSDSDDEDDDIESEEETPKKKVESNKKRSNDSASVTPVSKKSKLASAEKSDAKKGGHTATPHPAKKPLKTPAKAATPKSGGQFSCKSCDRSFGSDGALQSHGKAKHSGGK
ncbi:histone deacetylase HDT1-like [Cucurbita pepo subsp. pepo]|uniref:histone deacetylase HDT1-like n=1 Tax=Cucurbita pepo subsp. pepo TaxID=3664 RepID=UPI000C9DA3DA|nr:histone deacetylase HDT1-like [Cucurbita pepo subsp. pepo]